MLHSDAIFLSDLFCRGAGVGISYVVLVSRWREASPLRPVMLCRLVAYGFVAFSGATKRHACNDCRRHVGCQCPETVHDACARWSTAKTTTIMPNYNNA